MFTGIVTDIGTVRSVEERGDLRLVIDCGFDMATVDLGASIACSGCCLTVVDKGEGWFAVDVSGETRSKTAPGLWQQGARLNLERALRMGDRLGGHIVQGHVDGVGTVRETRRQGDAWLVDVAVPAELAALMVPHGSITVDGVSLTVNELPAPGVVQLSLIEYTMRHTTLGALAAGSRVHVEGDVIGKFVQRLVAPYLAADARGPDFRFPPAPSASAEAGSRT